MTHYLTYLERAIKNSWDKPGLSNYNGETFSFGDIATEIEKLHIIFEKIGIKKDDKIALCAKNTARWCISFFAVTSYGAVVVPILNDFLPESVEHLTDHSESVLLFTEKSIWEKIDVANMPKIKCIIDTDSCSCLYTDNNSINEVTENIDKYFAAKHPNGFTADDLHYCVDNLDKLALISYTSGTTSSPKGVMISARSISSNREYAVANVPNKPGETLVSMLPLAHLYGLAFELIYPLTSECHIYLLGKVPSPAYLLTALSDVKPYVIITVPLVIEKIIKGKVMPVVDKTPVKIAMGIPGIKQLLGKKITSKLLAAFGGNVRAVIMGGAAISESVEEVMRKIGLPYTIGYGMTECGPLIGYESTDEFAARSCGKIVDRMEVRIDSDNQYKTVGEIQVKGTNVMMGYYKNPEATKATFTEDGWLKTGDLGLLDKKGNIFIKGRSKNMILGSNGQNIFPEEVEDKVNNLPYVNESLVVSRGRKLVALVYPDYAKLNAAFADLNVYIKECVAKANSNLPSYSQLSTIELIDKEFEKTPKKSIKRFLYK